MARKARCLPWPAAGSKSSSVVDSTWYLRTKSIPPVSERLNLVSNSPSTTLLRPLTGTSAPGLANAGSSRSTKLSSKDVIVAGR